jgi:hypothetical protein
MKSLLAEKLSSAGSLPSGWTAQESFVFQVNMRQTLSRCERISDSQATLRILQTWVYSMQHNILTECGMFSNLTLHLLYSAATSSSRSDILEAVHRLMPSKSMEQLRDMDSHIWNASMWWSRLQELRQKWIRQSEAVRSSCQAILEQSVSTGAKHAEFCAEVCKEKVSNE